MDVRSLLEQIEAAAAGGAAPEAPLAYVAAQSLELDEDELAGSRRRALLVLAAGGDPRRELGPGGPAVAVLAADLDDPARRRELEEALAGLSQAAEGLPAVSGALTGLLADTELAWRWTCCALLAEELAD